MRSEVRANGPPPNSPKPEGSPAKVSFSSIAHVKAGGIWGVPKVRELFEATYFAGLREAGMPEE